MSRFLAFFAFALFSSVAWTQDLVVSTQPIYLIAQEVTKGIEKPTLLLADQSGHDVMQVWLFGWDEHMKHRWINS